MKTRNTLQKQIILNAVQEIAHHATANEVYDYVQARFPQIGRATVYRDLNFLATEGLVKKIDIPGESARYDHNNKAHYHAKCVKCERIFDLDIPYFSELDCREDMNGMKLLGHQIVFECICEACQKEQNY